jgi:hypothetical protein
LFRQGGIHIGRQRFCATGKCFCTTFCGNHQKISGKAR